MTVRPAAALLLAAMLAAPALAQTPAAPPRLTPETFDAAKQAPGLPDGDIVRLGRLAVELGGSKLEDVAAALGRKPARIGDGAAALSWICLHQHGPNADTRFWFVSDELSGGLVSEIVVASLPAATPADAACAAPAAARLPILLPGDLAPGGDPAALQARLGPPAYAKGGLAYFFRSSELPLPNGPCELDQSLAIRVVSGRVAQLALRRQGVC